jgi:hypothetical protein
MQFDVAGPFKLSRHGHSKILTKTSASELKPRVEDWETGLSEACDCYVFALQAGGGSKPYYIGQACKRALLAEAMNASNLNKYNEVLGSRKRGKPVLFLLPMRTPRGKFRKRKTGNGRIGALDFLERWLIAHALERNPKLKNNRETRFLKKIHVTGIFNAKKGESTKDAQYLSATLWKL